MALDREGVFANRTPDTGSALGWALGVLDEGFRRASEISFLRAGMLATSRQ
jgi:hypothetical protein